MPIQTKVLSAVIATAAAAAMLAVPAAAHREGHAKRDKVEVNAPYTHVETRGKRKTKVRVNAPYTHVDVNTKKRRVHINVPYFNQTIRW